MGSLEHYRDFLLAITIYTLIRMLLGSPTITWNTVIINFGMLVGVVLIYTIL